MESRPSCPKCESNNVYVRVGRELVCRRCGYVGSVGGSESGKGIADTDVGEEGDPGTQEDDELEELLGLLED